jgi:hypothetical protein
MSTCFFPIFSYSSRFSNKFHSTVEVVEQQPEMEEAKVGSAVSCGGRGGGGAIVARIGILI